MKRKIVIGIGLLFIMGFLFACETMPKYGVGAAYIARKSLNDYWESYLDLRDTMVGEQKVTLMAKFKDTGKDSIFTEAKRTLEAWDTVIGTVDELQAQQDYQKLLSKIIILLFQYNVIELEK